MDAYLTEELRRAASLARQSASSDELSNAVLRDRFVAISIGHLMAEAVGAADGHCSCRCRKSLVRALASDAAAAL
jgi:hypothetical protein